MEKFLNQPDPPTAVQVIDNYNTLEAYMAIYEKELKISDYISMVGVDNILMSRNSNLPFTTVSQPIYAMGEKAVELLICYITRTRVRLKRNSCFLQSLL